MNRHHRGYIKVFPYFLFLLFFLFALTPLMAQKNADVFIDKNGVMRWGTTREEIRAFGVNYTVPFAHAYRTAVKRNIPIERAIDDDVYHFARLGFDLYRVHVWDCEISDSVGNLLPNEHLRLFDYMLKKMKDRGMKFVLTPIAFWPNGFPEPPEKTPGFATKYGKDACLTNEDAIKAQEDYLYQFLNHVNPYTKIAYKNDPDIIAFEISNEPHHKEAPEKVTAYIRRMMKSMQRTGSKKPIFYNISHSIHLSDAYFRAGIHGGTFQWYPTGLGARHELGGNLLPNVDRYVIPFGNDPGFKKIGKLVYEFDAADVGRSYIYPAMARSFREAGMQIATHFAYDPTYMADVNTEYNTHYMNLAFTPSKALSLKIASEVFHRIPLYKSFGKYPENTSFGDFKVSYEEDLAEMVSDKKFFYTNHTTSKPSAPGALEEVAGWGNSSVVRYEGTGAYFLDRIQPGVWRLEVMPDAIWIEDPFTRSGPTKKMAVINWREWPMSVELPDLGKDFSLQAVNDGNTFSPAVKGTGFSVSPGVYVLTKKGLSYKADKNKSFKNIMLGEFAAPASTVKEAVIIHHPAEAVTANMDFSVDATVVSADKPGAVKLMVYTTGSWRPEVLSMEHEGGYDYNIVVPAKLVKEGVMRYYLVAETGEGDRTFPGSVKGGPMDWDFIGTPYSVDVQPENSPVYLFHAATDVDQLSRQWNANSVMVPLAEPGQAELRVNIDKLQLKDEENANTASAPDYSLRYFFGKKIRERSTQISGAKKIIFRGRALNDRDCKVQLALITRNGVCYGGIITLGKEAGDHALILTDLKPVRQVTLPRPYPTFLPYFFEPSGNTAFDLDRIEVLQISLGPGIPEGQLGDKHGFAIESIRLE